MTISTPVPRRSTFRAEREFGFLVGSLLALLGAWWTARGKFDPVAPWLIAVGGLLVAAAAAAPRALAKPLALWMGLAERLASVVTFVVLSIVYFLVVTPIGLVMRARGWDPLARRAPASRSYWRQYSPRQRRTDHYRKMY